jgi:hypothetical protein
LKHITRGDTLLRVWKRNINVLIAVQNPVELDVLQPIPAALKEQTNRSNVGIVDDHDKATIRPKCGSGQRDSDGLPGSVKADSGYDNRHCSVPPRLGW